MSTNFSFTAGSDRLGNPKVAAGMPISLKTFKSRHMLISAVDMGGHVFFWTARCALRMESTSGSTFQAVGQSRYRNSAQYTGHSTTTSIKNAIFITAKVQTQPCRYLGTVASTCGLRLVSCGFCRSVRFSLTMPTWVREWGMRRFKACQQAQRFLSVHVRICLI